MEYVILGFLFFRPMTVYDLNKAFEQGASLFYSASLGSLQVALKKLLKEGFIDFIEVVENGRRKKIYRLNDTGRTAFFQWFHADIPSAKLEVGILSRVFFLGHLQSMQERQTFLKNTIGRVEADLEPLKTLKASLQQLSLPPEAQVTFKYQVSTLDYGIMTHEGALVWLKNLLHNASQDV